jgi:hypothetical protein
LDKTKLDEYQKILEIFLSEYEHYINRNNYGRDAARTKLQRQSTLISRIVSSVHVGCALTLSDKDTIHFHQALSYSLTDTVDDSHTRIFIESNVTSVLNEAIGNIQNNTIPDKEIKPVIPIKDEVLKKRCSDLLNAPGNYDRVIREATLVLEERLRTSIPYEKLCEIIPLSKEQVGEPLANKLLAPNNPILVVSDKLPERIAFHKMMIGIISYLRNPSHHSLNDDIDWAFAWSLVGLVDSLLYELDNSFKSEEKPIIKE